jgi:hypothetical protein
MVDGGMVTPAARAIFLLSQWWRVTISRRVEIEKFENSKKILTYINK